MLLHAVVTLLYNLEDQGVAIDKRHSVEENYQQRKE